MIIKHSLLMGNTQTIHFQANLGFKSYRWFHLRKADVNVMQLDNAIIDRFKIPDDKTFTVSFLPAHGDWILLDTDDDIVSMFRLAAQKGTKKKPISLEVTIVDKE